jgi:hypothetical protein
MCWNGLKLRVSRLGRPLGGPESPQANLLHYDTLRQCWLVGRRSLDTLWVAGYVEVLISGIILDNALLSGEGTDERATA